MTHEEASRYIQSRMAKQAQADTGSDAQLKEYWSAFPAGVGLVMRAGETAQTGFVYRKGAPYLLTYYDLIEMMVRSQGRCEISGIQFSDEQIPGCSRRPFIPSIDRIKPKEPYIFDNCRLVCWAVNRALGEWGDEVFWRIVKAASVA
jgi:hypothetical protein